MSFKVTRISAKHKGSKGKDTKLKTEEGKTLGDGPSTFYCCACVLDGMIFSRNARIEVYFG